MDFRELLKKYKFELKELASSKKLELDRENNIYTAEIERIKSKYNEFLADLDTQKQNINKAKSDKFQELEKVKQELEGINLTLQQHRGNKFKLREELLRNIQATNKMKREIRQNNVLLNNQKTELETQIKNHRDFIADYENKRRQINEDYYNLQSEITETQDRIAALPVSDRKATILQDYLQELGNDPRANPNARYTDLDAEIRAVENKIAILEYQLQKHLNYMSQMRQNVNTTQELFLSSYLENAKAQIPLLMDQQREKCQLINSIQSELDNFELLLKKLNDTRMPGDLKEQQDRAEKRLSIITKRVCADTDPMIDELTQKIMDIEKQIQTMGWKNTLHTPTETQINDSSINPSSSIIPTINNIIPVNGESGKSRKELERLRKLANQTM